MLSMVPRAKKGAIIWGGWGLISGSEPGILTACYVQSFAFYLCTSHSMDLFLLMSFDSNISCSIINQLFLAIGILNLHHPLLGFPLVVFVDIDEDVPDTYESWEQLLCTGCYLNIIFPRIFESLPPLPRQHSALGCTTNFQPIASDWTLVLYWELWRSLTAMYARERLQWIVTKRLNSI